MEGGTLLLGHLDVPIGSHAVRQGFRRDPEHLFGEGIASSRAPLTMMEFALRALRSQRRLRHIPLGVLYYMDEGHDCRYSGEIIRRAASRAKRVLVLRPGNPTDRVITQRRGQRKYVFTATAEPRRPGKASKKTELMLWAFDRLEAMCRLSSANDRISVSVVDLKPESFPMLLPHRISARILLTYSDERKADSTEELMRDLPRDTYRGELEIISDRPPMKERRGTLPLFRALKEVAQLWEIPLHKEASVWPSAAGLIPAKTPVLCGLGPVAEGLYTPHESIQRISLLQRTLLLAQFLLQDSEASVRKRRR